MEDNEELKRAIDTVLARRDPKVRENLLDKARNGAVEILLRLGEITNLPMDVVEALVVALTRAVEHETHQAESGVSMLGEQDLARNLTQLNMYYPAAASWVPIVQMLRKPG